MDRGELALFVCIVCCVQSQCLAKVGSYVPSYLPTLLCCVCLGMRVCSHQRAQYVEYVAT